MEHIKFKFDFKQSGMPLVKFVVDNKIYKNYRCIHNGSIEFDCELEDGNHVIEIVHYGKNYITDTDTYFELQKLYINQVDIKEELWNFVQHPDIPPWDEWHIDNDSIKWKNNLYLGHNGKLVYNKFTTPSIPWFHHHFSTIHQPKGMTTDNDLLQSMKEEFFKDG